mgnify:CR=1 FL=1
MAMPSGLGKVFASEAKQAETSDVVDIDAARIKGHRVLGTGKAAFEVSALGFGVMGMTYNRSQHPDKKECIRLLHEAVERGVTLFDTAIIYGPLTNENLAGEALSEFKGRINVTTKFGHEVIDGKGTGRQDSRPATIRRYCEESLRRLRLDSLPMFYQHRADPNTPAEEVAATIADLIKEGKVQRWGMCEVSAETIHKAHAICPLTAIQSEYHLMHRLVEENGVLDVCRELGIDAPAPELTEWEHMVERIKHADRRVTIGLVGKYVQLHDAYLSVAEALRHAGYALGAEVDIRWIDSETITESDAEAVLGALDGIIVPGGFGQRGINGMILTAKYAREHRVPYFGICLGMQIAVIEYARHAAGIADADSGEFNELCENKVIDFMPGQSDEIDKGGTLRLGAYPCVIRPGTTMERCYGTLEISERHRHRYEFNNDYREALTSAGLVLSGLSPDGRLVETVELTDQPFFVGVQYHPEFKSRPNHAHPLFKGFVQAALERENA